MSAERPVKRRQLADMFRLRGYRTCVEVGTWLGAYADCLLSRVALDCLYCVDPWDGGSSGKAAWGCSMLYRVSGEPRYRDIALHVARNYLAAQSPDGWYGEWEETSGYGAGEGGAPAKEFAPGDFDGTGETIIWLGLIGSNLLARDSD